MRVYYAYLLFLYIFTDEALKKRPQKKEMGFDEKGKLNQTIDNKSFVKICSKICGKWVFEYKKNGFTKSRKPLSFLLVRHRGLEPRAR
jgi:hypothetical protein